MHNHLKHATHRIAGPQHRVHLGLHPRLGFRIHAVQQNLIPCPQRHNLLPRHIAFQLRAAHANHMTRHVDAQLQQQLFRQRSRCHSRGRFARRRPFQDIPRIGKIERARLISARLHREDSGWVGRPMSAEEHGAAGREPCSRNIASAIGQALKARLRRAQSPPSDERPGAQR